MNVLTIVIQILKFASIWTPQVSMVVNSFSVSNQVLLLIQLFAVWKHFQTKIVSVIYVSCYTECMLSWYLISYGAINLLPWWLINTVMPLIRQIVLIYSPCKAATSLYVFRPIQYTVEPVLSWISWTPLYFGHFLWVPNNIHRFSMQCCLHSMATCLIRIVARQPHLDGSRLVQSLQSNPCREIPSLLTHH